MSIARASDILTGPAYQGYAYSYPHKTAHRPLDRPVALDALWAQEKRDALFLYLHLPFCRSRCGYCNLFAQAACDAPRHRHYVRVLARQGRRVRDSLGAASFARLAIGGGTPSCLPADLLAEILRIASDVMGVDLRRTPTSIEVSPGTTSAQLCRLLADHHVDRLSVGVQSYSASGCKTLGRPQDPAEVDQCLTMIREAGIRTLNVDLIYGIPGQSLASWRESLERALTHRPEELYLYPLYFPPLTAMADQAPKDDAPRLDAYRLGRDLLQAKGYHQVSMRLFHRAQAARADTPIYRCQRDGMVGLGCGPRSYTRALHYSGPYAVAQRNVRAILDGYLACDEDAFGRADFGIRLDPEDQRRRYVIQTLLQCPGLDRADYLARFGSDVLADLPELTDLRAEGLGIVDDGRVRLTDMGIERSDVIGPWLYSPKVRRLMQEYRWR